MRWRRDLAAMAVVALAAAAFTFAVLWQRAQVTPGVPSTDIYGAHYPNLVYALEHLRTGHGLLWNRLQNCGQPFLPSTLLGLFYPLHVLFLWLEPNWAFVVTAALHLAIGGIGTFLWCRSLGCAVVSAMCGAVAFVLGAPAVFMAVWLPTTILGVYAWLPVALYCCERLLKEPTLRVALALGAVLSIQALPGYPQINVFTYQFILLRVAWEGVTGHLHRARSVSVMLLVALTLPLLLAAMQLYPMAEFARLSLRNKELSWEEANPFGAPSWSLFRLKLGTRQMGAETETTIAMIPMALAALALGVPRHRRLALLFVMAALAYLALVYDTPLRAAYEHLPLGRTFRGPERFYWMLGMTFSPLVAFAIDGLQVADRRTSRRVSLIGAPLLGAAAFWLLAPNGLVAEEWLLLAALVAACVTAVVAERWILAARVAVGVLLAANLLSLNSRPFLGFLRDDRVLYQNAPAFAFVRSRATAQDRTYLLGQSQDHSLSQKTSLLFDLPTIDDYEPQTSRRYAELFVRLLYGAPMSTINMHVFRLQSVPGNRGLFDLVAGRYVIADTRLVPKLEARLRPRLQPLWQDTHTAVYENAQAMPRAFYVPRIAVMPDATELLDRLASPEHDPRRAALVEEVPADGFLGTEQDASGEVEIVEDLSETLVLRVRASASGFLSLQDQFYPGWSATVNGAPAEILRANYAFRTTRVPAGESLVVFRYRPWSAYAGFAVSLGTATAIAAYYLWSRRKHGAARSASTSAAV